MKITCHMIASVDGRLIPAFWSPLADPSAGVNDVYESVAKKFEAEGWIVGRKTMAEFTDIVEDKEPIPGTRTMHTGTYIGAREGRPIAVVFDATGRLHYKSANLPTGEHIVAVLGSHVTRAYQKELEEVGVSYIVRTPGSHREETVNALQTIEKDFGVTKLLLEGGGIINGSFMQMGLVDELSVIIYPGVDGKAGRPSIIECQEEAYQRPMEHSKLTLENCEKLDGGYVWLNYKINPA